MKLTKWLVLGAVVLGAARSAAAEFALFNLGPERGGGTRSPDSVHGWQFRVNEDILVTHLGLFDFEQDGFIADHPIGLFDLLTATLLTSGTMSAGTGDTLIDEFRYIDTPDAMLEAGREYVISYYTGPPNTDFVITDATFDVHPAIEYLNGRWGTGAGGLIIPENITSATRIGPNFQFSLPAPGTLALLGLVAVTGRRRRRE